MTDQTILDHIMIKISLWVCLFEILLCRVKTLPFSSKGDVRFLPQKMYAVL